MGDDDNVGLQEQGSHLLYPLSKRVIYDLYELVETLKYFISLIKVSDSNLINGDNWCCETFTP